jgi:FdhD protein
VTDRSVVPEPSSATSTRVVEDVVAWKADTTTAKDDLITVEEPLEIRFAGLSVAVTMRTPGDDFDLALGFLFTEGILHTREDVASTAYCPSADLEAQGNIVNVNPTHPGLVDPQRWQRNFFSTSSCGICGKASIDAIHQQACPVQSRARMSHETLYRLDERLRAAQEDFARTGGLHAAGLFGLDGELIAAREDVGRHNAVDKVIGDALRRGALPLTQSVLVVSSRASFEVTQKALMAGIPIVAAVSAPSSLAVDLARSANMTLIGFLRSGRCNIYSGAERVV